MREREDKRLTREREKRKGRGRDEVMKGFRWKGES